MNEKEVKRLKKDIDSMFNNLKKLVYDIDKLDPEEKNKLEKMNIGTPILQIAESLGMIAINIAMEAIENEWKRKNLFNSKLGKY